jgi:hypothetical protein
MLFTKFQMRAVQTSKYGKEIYYLLQCARLHTERIFSIVLWIAESSSHRYRNEE